MPLVESSLTRSHAQEITAGERFAFGRNWAYFLARVNDQRIELAIKSLQDFLQLSDLEGLSFLDIGSGSGLFSLAARRLGARVHSFDYDPHSVACTVEMRRRYAPGDSAWTIEQGSVLDAAYLTRLGQFDVVYAWGVLHHTGQMRQAMENVKPLVPVGGRLFIAIYNDLGPITDAWESVKRRYNSLPKPLSLLYALRIIWREEWQSIQDHYRNCTLREWVRTWTDYEKVSTRGMSRWIDWTDWIGGFPYERARLEDIVDRFAVDGFRLAKVVERSGGYGCNEFVFHRDYPAGVPVDVPIPGARAMVRRAGLRLPGHPTGGLPPQIARRLQDLMRANRACTFFIIQNDRLLGTLARGADGLPTMPANVEVADSDAVYVVAAAVRRLAGPFHHFGGFAWSHELADLREIADPGEDGGRRSPVFVFENGVQLPLPHELHDVIRANGGGRFSHWENNIIFSASDNSDPNTNGRVYELLIPVPHNLSEDDQGATKPSAVLALSCGTEVHRKNQVVLRELSGFSPVGGVGFKIDSLEYPGDTPDDPHRSTVLLLEDGVPLGPAHTDHDEIRQKGGGRYSHWHTQLYFSTTDNSDPRQNGRAYHAYYAVDVGQNPAATRAIEHIRALPADYTPAAAYRAIESGLRALDPTAILGDPHKSYWHDAAFVLDFRRLCGEDSRTMERKYAVYQLIKALYWVPGDIAECGAYNGGTAYFMALAGRDVGNERPFHLFDSFAGLSSPLELDGEHWKVGELAASQDELQANLAGFSDVHIHPGWIPTQFHRIADRQFCFVHVDVDLHDPTRDSLNFFYPRLAPGGILLCDDYGSELCPGARKAMDDYFADKPERIIDLPTEQGLIIKR